MIKKIMDNIYSREIDIKVRLIHRIIIIGLLLCFLSLAEIFLFTSTYWTTIPVGVIFASFIFAAVLAFRFNRDEAASVVIGIVAIGVGFPAIFFMSGGINGGSSVWFVLGIFYSIGMFSGRKQRAITCFAIVVDFFTYFIGYMYPELITEFANRKEVFLDSLFAVVLVGIMMGVVTKFQLREYTKERESALKQKEEVEKISSGKNEFFAKMSHEIRTPINTIIGLNEMILREEQISDEVVDNALTIQNASKMLLSLVNDILDLSQIESKKMEISAIDYDTKNLFYELLDMISTRVNEKGLEFVMDVDRDMPTTLHGDDKRINQVLLNLLTNAVKYTKEGSVKLNARYEKVDDEWCKLIVSVSDTGIGIKKESVELLFDSFQRIDTTENRKIEGTGLGLSISKQLIELMDGEITVDSIYTKGSTFTISVEQKIVDATPIGPVNFMLKENGTRNLYHQSFEAPDANVLLVDDNEMNRMVIKKLLRATKVNVDTAKSGLEALEMTLKKQYHVILMDYFMPELDGRSTMLQIQKQENGYCRETPIVVLTADATLNGAGKYVDMGFDGFVEKPVKGIQLEETILNLLPEDKIEYRMNMLNNLENKKDVFVKKERKKKKILITTDCVCDLPQELVSKYDIRMMYLFINTVNGRMCDTIEIDSDNLLHFPARLMRNTTVDAPTMEDYENFFAECLTEAEEVIHISVSKLITKSYHNAIKASRGFGHVRVIDSSHISGGMALLVLEAAKMAIQGAAVNEICARIAKQKSYINTTMLLPNLDYLYNNGSTSRLLKNFCNVFKGHPYARISEGNMKINGFFFGDLDNSRRRFLRYRLQYGKKPHYEVLFVTYAGLSVKEQEFLIEEVNKIMEFDTIIMNKCCVTNACAAGLGTVSIAYSVER